MDRFIKAEAEFKRVCNCKTTTPAQFEKALRDYYEAKEDLYGEQPTIIGSGTNKWRSNNQNDNLKHN